MKRLLLVFVFLVIAVDAGAVSLTCDVPTGVLPTVYKLTGPEWVPASVPAKATGEILLDVSMAPVGANSMTVASCITDPIWGEACSAPVNFTFIRPSAPAITKGIKLIP